MPSFTGRVYDISIISGQLSGAGFFTGRMWPDVKAPTPAVVAAVSPVVGSIVSSGTTWSAEITAKLGEILCWASYDGLNVVEMVYDGSDFCPNFKPLSSLVQIQFAPQTPKWRITVKRSNGWPGDPKIFLRVRTDDGGVNP